jgi:hypothetical protein
VYKQTNFILLDKQSLIQLLGLVNNKPVMDRKNEFDGSSIVMIWYGSDPIKNLLKELIV